MNGTELGNGLKEAWLKAGDDGLSRCFLNSTEATMRRILCRQFSRLDELCVDDIVQDSFLILLEKLKTGEVDKLFGFLIMTARRKCLEELKDLRLSKKIYKARADLEPISVVPIPEFNLDPTATKFVIEEYHPELEILQSEQKRLVHSAIERTTKGSQKILIYLLSKNPEFHFNIVKHDDDKLPNGEGDFNMPGKDAAKDLGMTHVAYRKARERAYKSLEKELRKLIVNLDVGAHLETSSIFRMHKTFATDD